MQKKILLLATFIDKNNLDEFLYKLYKEFGVKKKSVFIFDSNGTLILTYRLFLELDRKLDIRKELNNTIQVHKKGTTFFTINSLNKLIEKEYNLTDGNVDHSQYEIDWSKYENMLISLTNNTLEILPLNKIFI
jgi:hypothetical protein